MRNDPINLMSQYCRKIFIYLIASFGILALAVVVTNKNLPDMCLFGGIVILIGIITCLLWWDGIISLKGVVSLLLAVAIMFPYIRLPGVIPDVRPELIIVLVVWCLIIMAYLTKGRTLRLGYLPVYKWFGIFAFAIVLSITYVAWINEQMPIWRDFWEIIKLLLYFLIFVLVANVRLTHTDLRRYFKLALIVFLISACFGFFQYFNFAGINELVSPYYAPTQMKGLLGQGRITGTTPNPNEFGALMVLASSLALSGALFYREWKLSLFCWCSLFVYGIALFLTLSRTSLVCLFLAGLIIVFLFFREKGLRGKFNRILIVALLGCLLVVLLLQIMPEKAFTRFGELRTFTEATSFQARVEAWKVHFDIWLGSPLFGWGPGKGEMSTIVDNEWLLILRRYGLVGLMVFISLFGCLFLGLPKTGTDNSDPSVKALIVALKGTFISYGLYMMLSSVYHSMQLMPILLLFVGLAYTQRQSTASLKSWEVLKS